MDRVPGITSSDSACKSGGGTTAAAAGGAAAAFAAAAAGVIAGGVARGCQRFSFTEVMPLQVCNTAVRCCVEDLTFF